MADPPNAESSPPEPSLPDVQRALAEQYTDVVKRQVERFAKERALLVRRAGIAIPRLKDYAEELAHDAMVSIWSGARRWAPTVPLMPHLCNLIKDRTWHEIQRAVRHPRVSFDLAANDSDDALDLEPVVHEIHPAGGDVETSLAASRGDLAPIRIARLAREVVDALRQLARKDDDVRRILAAWELDIFEREEVMVVAELDAHAYDAARQRIRRLARRLPPDLREAALDLLRSAS